jgi:hypothetical protein
MEFGGRLSPEEFWRHVAADEERIRAAAHLLPLYGLAGWDGPLMTGDWRWSGGELECAGLSHGAPNGASLQVVTTAGDPGPIAHTLRMTDELERLGPPRSGDDLDAMRERLAAAPARSVTAGLGGRTVEFTRWDGSLRWHAAAPFGEHGLVLEGRDLDPAALQLERVTDVEPYLAGRNAYLRRLRGED